MTDSLIFCEENPVNSYILTLTREFTKDWNYNNGLF